MGMSFCLSHQANRRIKMAIKHVSHVGSILLPLQPHRSRHVTAHLRPKPLHTLFPLPAMPLALFSTSAFFHLKCHLPLQSSTASQAVAAPLLCFLCPCSAVSGPPQQTGSHLVHCENSVSELKSYHRNYEEGL